MSLPALSQEGWTKEKFLEEADLVFIGRLVDQEGFWDAAHRLILTRHVFYVEDVLAGNPDRVVEVTAYGGTVDGLEMSLSHSTRYIQGQEYLVFSYLDSRQRNRTLAGPLGQFQIVTEVGGNRIVKVYPTHPLSGISDTGGGAGIFRTLESFSRVIRTALNSHVRSED